MTSVSAQYSIMIIGADGLSARPEIIRSVLRQEVREIAARALASVRLRQEDVLTAEHGEEYLLRIPPTESPGKLAGPFVEAINNELAARAAGQGPADALRLTVALHQPADDAAGHQPADAVHLAEALLRAPALAAVHKAAPRGYLVLIVSTRTFQLLCQDSYGRVDTAAFLPLRLDSGQVTGWVTVPGYPAPPGMTGIGAPAADRDLAKPGQPDPPSYVGVLVQDGGQVANLVSGHQVIHGDQIFGNVIHGDQIFGHRADETGLGER